MTILDEIPHPLLEFYTLHSDDQVSYRSSLSRFQVRCTTISIYRTDSMMPIPPLFRAALAAMLLLLAAAAPGSVAPAERR